MVFIMLSAVEFLALYLYLYMLPQPNHRTFVYTQCHVTLACADYYFPSYLPLARPKSHTTNVLILITQTVVTTITTTNNMATC